MDVLERIKGTVEGSPIVLFMKGTPQFPQCGFSGQVVQIRRTDRTRFRDGQIQPNPTNQRTPQ